MAFEGPEKGGRGERQLGRGLVLLMAFVALLSQGCGGDELPAHDKASLIDRVPAGLEESGAPGPLAACLSDDLDNKLSEEDADRVYGDISSYPHVSEHSLNVVSLAYSRVRSQLERRASKCKTLLVTRHFYMEQEVEALLHRIWNRIYRRPGVLSGR
jgi:hypothetical protein